MQMMRKTTLALAATLIAGTPATATAQDGPPRGCFQRQYSDAHLAGQPDQIVRDMKLMIMDAAGYDEVWADLTVLFTNQGRVRGTRTAGAELTQTLGCYPGESGMGACSVDCDGGYFEVTRDTGDSITIKTYGLTIGPSDSCGGYEHLSEIHGQPTSYKLYKVDDLTCGVIQ